MARSKKIKEKTTVIGIICPECKDFIYSVSVHDYHCCTCGLIMIDGGFEYIRYGFNKSSPKAHLEDLHLLKLQIPVAKDKIIDDYLHARHGKRKYGIIKEKDLSKLFKVLFT